MVVVAIKLKLVAVVLAVLMVTVVMVAAVMVVPMAVAVAPVTQQGQVALEAEAQCVLFGPEQLDSFLQRLQATYECAGSFFYCCLG